LDRKILVSFSAIDDVVVAILSHDVNGFPVQI